MIYSSFHMTQDVAVAILPRIGRIGVLRHFFISTTDSTDNADTCPVVGDIDQKVCCFPWAYTLAA